MYRPKAFLRVITPLGSHALWGEDSESNTFCGQDLDFVRLVISRIDTSVLLDKLLTLCSSCFVCLELEHFSFTIFHVSLSLAHAYLMAASL